ncbi:MAG: hypothetical protein K1X28_05625 [Parachlamydiales bacterium]|nr:hypothetical protein [Parachlamydiales bacterium]
MERASREPAKDAYILLRVVFIFAPIIAGFDKFFNLLVDWEQYLGVHFGAYGKTFMMIAGVVEIIAGLGVIFRPKLFANIIGLWLALIIINLLILEDFFDIALRDFGLCLSAFALGRLAKVYGR